MLDGVTTSGSSVGPRGGVGVVEPPTRARVGRGFETARGGVSDDDETTPVQRVSTAALNLADIAAEDLTQYLQKAKWDHTQERAMGFLERVHYWLTKVDAAYRPIAIERDALKKKLREVERERDRLANLMRRE